MRHRRNGFTSFMKKLDGVEEHDYFSETAGFGSWFHSGYECVLELLRGNICWATYLDRLDNICNSERVDAYYIRGEVAQLNIPSRTLGVYVTDQSAYDKAIKYFRLYQASQQQENVSTITDGSVSSSGSSHYYNAEYRPLGR